MTKAHGTILGGAATSNMDEGAAVRIRLEDGNGVIRIASLPEQPLASGEYALSIRSVVTDLIRFGVN